jgi:hypothetical protein
MLRCTTPPSRLQGERRAPTKSIPVSLFLFQDRMMAELHARGTTPEDIRDCLRSAPLDAHVVSAVKTAAALGYARHHADHAPHCSICV